MNNRKSSHPKKHAGKQAAKSPKRPSKKAAAPSSGAAPFKPKTQDRVDKIRDYKKRDGKKPFSQHKHSDDQIWIYGRHAVAAALRNNARKLKRIIATKNAMDWLRETVPHGRLAALAIEDLKPEEIDRLLPPGSVHQGIAVHTEELSGASLQDVCNAQSGRPVVVLDQITDPQNIGAIFRTASAFGAQAVIFQDRRTPPLAGALAKAAAGAIETVPGVAVVNIARAIDTLKDLGFYAVGLAGEADDHLSDVPRGKAIALVMGAEGDGLRHLVGKTCDQLAKIKIASAMESLNVSNAAAIALYEMTRDS